MEEKLVEFANLLRQNGIRVSLAETLDAVAATDVTGLGERELFRAALRSTMIKWAMISAAHHPPFFGGVRHWSEGTWSAVLSMRLCACANFSSMGANLDTNDTSELSVDWIGCRDRHLLTVAT